MTENFSLKFINFLVLIYRFLLYFGLNASFIFGKAFETVIHFAEVNLSKRFKNYLDTLFTLEKGQ